MPDITMCEGTGCQWRGQCRRSPAVSDPDPIWQSWFATIPMLEDGSCGYFIEAQPEHYERDYKYED